MEVDHFGHSQGYLAQKPDSLWSLMLWSLIDWPTARIPAMNAKIFIWIYLGLIN